MNIFPKLSDWYWNLSRAKKVAVRLTLLGLAVVVVVYFAFMPPRSVPMDLPIAGKSAAARAATEQWWDAFHADSVESLPEVLRALTAAHDVGPPDPLLSTILASAHLWRFITRHRTGLSRDEVVAALEASRRYGEEAVRLDPGDDTATAPSIVSITAWILNELQGRPEANAAIAIDVLKRSMVYPEFAGFIQGWLIGGMHKPGDRYFDQVELGYDVVLEACASPLTIPDPPRFNKLLHTIFALRVWRAPVCYENVAAPHNIEGMFFAMGDAWLKAGDVDRARIWYENVKTAPRYDSWKYKDLLEARLRDLAGHRRKFLADTGKILDVAEPAMQFQSEHSCGVCHTR